MIKQVTFVINGFLLLLVFLLGLWVVQLVINIKPSPASTEVFIDTDPLASQNGVIVYNKKGQELFKNNCAACHSLTRHLTGPALAGIESRVTDQKLLYAWIRNNQSVLATGNKYFNGLYNRFNKTAMTVFPSLTDEDIKDILEYIKQTTNNKPVVVPVAVL